MATSEKDKISRFLEKELSVAKEAAQGKDDSKAKADYEALLKDNPDLNFKEWGLMPIEKKLAEIERNKELPPDRIEKMKAIHADFKTLAK